MVLAALACTFLFQEANPAPAPPRARRWDEFPVFVWREKYKGQPLPEELAEPFGGVILMREEDSSWARERGLSYLVWNVAGRDALHLDADEAWNERVERWIETRDEKLLVREPCLNDPETVAELFATLNRTIAKHGEHPGLGFVLGDEVGLTPNGDPFDLCRCGLCEANWKEYAKGKGLPERAPLTDEVRLALLEDDFSLLGAWLARRRFERSRLSGLLQALSEHVRRQPSLPVGLLGISGPSFGGIDLDDGLPFLDFVECYAAGGAREMLNAFPPRGLPFRQGHTSSMRPGFLATIFVGNETADGAARSAWEHWLRGCDGLVLWSDEVLVTRPETTVRLARAVAQIRRIEQRFPRLLSPSFAGVALVHDSDSVALSWLKDALLDGATWPRRRSGYQEERGTRERSRRAWLREIEDAGSFPASVPLSRLEELCFGGCSTLVLAHLLVLGPEDVCAIEEQLDRGASLVVEGPLGWVDRNGQPWKEDVLKRLQARAPDRVRTSAGHPPVNSRAWGPVFSGEAGQMPWLTSTRMTEAPFHMPADVLFTALPNPRQLEAEPSKPLELEIEAPAGYHLEWIHPTNRAELPPGDAAVFLLHSVTEGGK